MNKHHPVEVFASAFGESLGRTGSFVIAVLLFLVWSALIAIAPTELYERPRLFVVELTGMFIFIHLFLIQRVHNKDIKAIQLKLDELISSVDGANNQLIKAEKHPEKVLKEVHEAYEAAADQTSHQTKPIVVDRHALGAGQRHEDNVAPQAVSEERA